MDFTPMLRTIATDRSRLETLRARKNDLLAQVTESQEYKDLMDEINRVSEEIIEVSTYVQAHALDAYIATGNKKPAPGIQVKVFTRLVYGPTEALDWARKNLPEALRLDTKFFEAHAKGVMKTTPIPFVAEASENVVQLASDLSEYLVPEELKPEEEIPF